MSFSSKSPDIIVHMPAFLPQELRYCESIQSEDILLSTLIKNPRDLVIFFECACADETWSEQNSGFMRKAIAWLTMQVFQDKMPIEFTRRIAKAMQAHYSILSSYIPENILFKLKDTSVQANSLLFAAFSDYFKDLLERECREKNKMFLTLADTTYTIFSTVVEYMTTGKVYNLGQKGLNEMLELAHDAAKWGIEDLVAMSEEALKKFITNENVFKLLSKSYQERWPNFKQSCLNFFNHSQNGVRLSSSAENQLSFEFLDFSDRVINLYEQMKSLVTEIVCSGSLTESERFGMILKRSPKIIALNISGSRFFSTQLLETPRELQALDISQCPWMNQAALKQFSDICPHLRKLSFGSDIQLNFTAWGELNKFRQLIALDLTRCHQINDQDLMVILKACLGLRELSLEECRKISEKGFDAMARQATRLTHLNLSRTSITDNSLVEISTYCRSLISLDLTRCENVTDKGVLAVVKQASSLKELTIAQCPVSTACVKEINRLFPQIMVRK